MHCKRLIVGEAGYGEPHPHRVRLLALSPRRLLQLAMEPGRDERYILSEDGIRVYFKQRADDVTLPASLGARSRVDDHVIVNQTVEQVDVELEIGSDPRVLACSGFCIQSGGVDVAIRLEVQTRINAR